METDVEFSSTGEALPMACQVSIQVNTGFLIFFFLMAWGLLCIPHLLCHTQTLPITGLWPDPQRCCNPLLKVISTRWLGQFGLCQILSVSRKYPVLYPSAALDLACVCVHMQCLFTPSVSFLISGFQMHARFPLNASSRDHYRWSSKVSMAAAAPWW